MHAPVWVSITVWLELGWLLDCRLKISRDIVSDALAALLTLDTVHTADRAALSWAVERFRAGADWADMVHLVSAQASAEAFATFSYRLERQAGLATPIPVETLA